MLLHCFNFQMYLSSVLLLVFPLLRFRDLLLQGELMLNEWITQLLPPVLSYVLGVPFSTKSFSSWKGPRLPYPEHLNGHRSFTPGESSNSPSWVVSGLLCPFWRLIVLIAPYIQDVMVYSGYPNIVKLVNQRKISHSNKMQESAWPGLSLVGAMAPQRKALGIIL